MAVTVIDNPDFMTEAEFTNELKDKNNVFIMSTSALDKIREYGELFSSFEIDGYFTGSGAFGINASKTPEMNGHYLGNLSEKEKKQLYDLTENEQLIRDRLNQSIPNAASANMIGMTEDSGGIIFPADVTKTSAFVTEVRNRIRAQLREEDSWLLDTLKSDEFPGANLRPVQEHLVGGIDSLMNILYDVAEEMGIDQLCYENTAHISFQSPKRYQEGKKAVFSIEARSGGRLFTRGEYEREKPKMDAVTFDAVLVPNGQTPPEESLNALKKKGLFTDTKNSPPARQYKVHAMAYLSSITGTRHINGNGMTREPHIGWLTPESVTTEKEPLNGFDAIVLRPSNITRKKDGLALDDNLSMAIKFAVHTVISPQQKYLILDNRLNGTSDKRPFDDIIKIFRNASISEHRSFGEFPFLIANTDQEMESHLQLVKRVTQRQPKVYAQPVTANPEGTKVDTLPNDGVFTVFIAGGHGNNSKADRRDGFNLGYMCAEHGYRIVTGAGSVDGSMGSVHTGYIQYHLDRIISGKSKTSASLMKELEKPEYRNSSGKISAETIISNNPSLIDRLADNGNIPCDMFYGYSMKSLLKLESVSGEAPPGITYFETGSVAQRIHHMTQAGTKIILPGSVGTDEELTNAMAQHLAARKTANDFSPFSDGTPKDAGVIIVYNPRNVFGSILKHFNLIDDKGRTTKTAKENNIIIINSMEKMHDSIDKTRNWQRSVVEKSNTQTAAKGK